MSAATFAPNQPQDVTLESLRLPAILSGLVLFAGGLVTQQPWMCFLGVAAFLGTYMSANATPHADTPGSARRVMFDDEYIDTQIGARADISEILTRADALGNKGALGDDMNVPALRLRPIVPLHTGMEINSWLGGNPYLPSDIGWPVLDDKPALFLAQISLAHVPADIWHGQGPRDGWLVVFASQSNLEHTHLLHTHRFGEERQPPEPLVYPGIAPKREDFLERVIGCPTAIPRWPVEFSRPDEQGAASHERADKTGRPFDDAQQMTAPGLVPFDWGSAMLLLEVASADLEWQHKVVTTLVESGEQDPRGQSFLETLSSAIGNLHALKDELSHARNCGLEFDDRLRGLMFEGLGMMELESAEGIGEYGTQPARQSVLEQDQIRRDYAHWVDIYARLLYSDTPGALPRNHRACFETRWAWHAMHERGWIGGTIPDHFATAGRDDAAGRVSLLRLQSSDLLGWRFGNEGELCISVGSDALTRGDFSQAVSEVSSR